MLRLKGLLCQMKASNTTIDYVYTFNTQEELGNPYLSGVTVQEVGHDFVIFNQVGSGGFGTLVMPIDKIVCIEY
ncbi:hypothetical protein [Pseudalkalibacillus sp. NRS-1564]|uniref:hypothetical protein n=1 Tax=Pseudalkalibacillus sp. NRS-1564 TaxID=3233900 RepID=UPI003D292481